MSEKRYFKIEYGGEWYLFDSTTISEQLVKEQAEYGYGVFANSLSPSEICDRLNTLHQENQELKHYKLYEDNKRLQTIIADLKKENEKLKEEDARLNQVIINLHDDLRKLTEQNRKLKNIVIWQQEIIQNYNELMQIVSSD